MTRLGWAAAVAVLAACATTSETTRDGLGREVVTLTEGDQRWVDGDGLSVFLHSVDPALEIVTVYLKPQDGEEEHTFTMGPESNRVVDYERWRIELVEIAGPDTATLAIGPSPTTSDAAATN